MRKGSAVTDHEYSKHKPAVVAKFAAMIENDGVILEQYRTKKFAQRHSDLSGQRAAPT